MRLSDLDTTILGFDNQPAWRKGRVWPRRTICAPGRSRCTRPRSSRSRSATRSPQLIRNGITTALPIASLFYRAWGETFDEFAAAADAAETLGLRVYLGPAYRTGNTYVRADGTIDCHFDEERGLRGLAEAIRFCGPTRGARGGLIRTMLAPDRLETCTAELLRRTAAAGRDLAVPVRQHACQSKIEYDTVVRLHGMSPPEWMAESRLSQRAHAAAARDVRVRLEPRGAAGARSRHHPRLRRDHRALPAGLVAPRQRDRELRPLPRARAQDRPRHRHGAARHDPEHAGRDHSGARDRRHGRGGAQRGLL